MSIDIFGDAVFVNSRPQPIAIISQLSSTLQQIDKFIR